MPTSSNNKQRTATEYIPYTYPVDEFTCATEDGDLVRTIQVAGVSFETMSNEQINGLERDWFSAINSIGTKYTNAGLWTHLIRRKLRYDMSSIEFDNYFSNELNQALSKRIENKDFYINELYVSPVFRTAPGLADKVARKMSRQKKSQQEMIAAGNEDMERITRQLMLSLKRYQPTLLECKMNEQGNIESEAARLYSRILNGGESAAVCVNQHSVRYAIQRNNLHFGHEIIEIEKPLGNKFVAVLGIKAPYGIEKVKADIIDGLLSVPCEYILSQSLTFNTTATAEKFLKKQLGQVQTTSNNKLIIDELETAISKLGNGQWSMGNHEFILSVSSDSIDELSKSISEIDVALSNKNLEIVRENSGMLISQYFSMLPGNFKMGRLRAMPIGSNNFSKFFPMHNFPIGNAKGSQWGMPLAMFETSGDGPYFLNYHVSRKALQEQGMDLEHIEEDEEDEDDETGDAIEGEITVGSESISFDKNNNRKQRKDSGNYQIIGKNGVGKTAIQAAIRTLTRKKNMKGARPYKSFTFDKDCGQELPIMALQGEYFKFSPGQPSGINVFSLPDDTASHQWIVTQALWCAKQDQAYVFKAKDEADLLRAVQIVYTLPSNQRRFARILDTLSKGTGSLHEALSRWAGAGMYAWVLDNQIDRFDLNKSNDFGFDMTSFLGIPEARTPILSYIVFKINSAVIGSPFSIDIDEASAALKDAFLLNMIDDKARTVRKLDGIIGLSFQNASDACTGPIAATLKGQFPTLFIFPDSTASREDYINGLKLSEREFELVRSGMGGAPGTFLVKKGAESVVVKADFSGMNNILSILSGSEDNCVIARQIINEVGPNPKDWIPEFYKRRT